MSEVEATPRNVAHLFRRAAWGATPEQISAWADGGDIEKLVRALLDWNAAPPAGSPHRRTQGDSVILDHEFHLWWWHLAVTSPTPAIERLAWFWHGHFATSLRKVEWADLMHQHMVMLRRHSLGGIDEILSAVTHDPAMNIWLDLHLSEVGAPNENYARELLELFSMGAGNGYGQLDVAQAARALTGYALRYEEQWRPMGTQLLPELHDFGRKTFLGVTGDLSADDLIATITARPECPEFIATRLWTRYAGTQPTPQTLAPIASALAGPDGSIHDGLVTLLTSPEFYSNEVMTGLVTQPVEILVRTARNFEIDMLDPNGRAFDYGDDGDLENPEVWDSLAISWWAERMGQEPAYPPNVGGWAHNEPWLDANRSAARLVVGREIGWHIVESESRIAQRLAAHTSPKRLAEAVLRQFGLVEWSEDTVDAVATAAAADGWIAVEHAIAAAFVSPEVVLA
ncbi:MAG: DUF1800 family protein [Acidimicrobiales bacterium]